MKYVWDPSTLEPDNAEEEKEGPKVKPSHRLLIKTAVLMPSAVKDQVTVVQIESEGYNKQTVSVNMRSVRFLIPCPGDCPHLCHEGRCRPPEVH